MASLLTEQAELIPQPKGVHQVLLSTFLPLLGCVPVECEEVVVVVLVHAVHLIVHNSENCECIVLSINLLQFIPNILEFMLQREEALSHNYINIIYLLLSLLSSP